MLCICQPLSHLRSQLCYLLWALGLADYLASLLKMMNETIKQSGTITNYLGPSLIVNWGRQRGADNAPEGCPNVKIRIFSTVREFSPTPAASYKNSRLSI